MKRKIFSYVLFLLSFGWMAGCESLEDTYSDYTGDGPERYLSTIYNLEGTPQWLAVKLTWKLKLDPARTGVVVKWSTFEKADSVVLDKDAETYTVTGLENFEYTFNVSAIEEKDGVIVNRSLTNPSNIVTEVYIRPYTNESDEMLAFSRGVKKCFKINNKQLVVNFDKWADNLLLFKIGYFEKNNSVEQFWEGEEGENGWPNGLSCAVIGEDIDFSQPISVYRRGKIEGFGNIEMDLAPIVLAFDVPVFEALFLEELRAQLNLNGEVSFADINEVEELYLNYDQSSLVDVLFFPNLKRLYLGANRYLASDDAISQSALADVEESTEALKIFAEQMNGEIYHYGKHYFAGGLDCFKEKNMTAEVPNTISLLETAGWEISVSPEDYDYVSGLENLLNLERDYWSPQSTTEMMREHIVTIDMKEVRSIQGFLIQQAEDITIPYGKTGNKPEMLKIEIEKEGGVWEQATFSQSVTIGDGSYEKTVVYLNKDKSSKQTSKVRFRINDSGYKPSYSASFTDYKTALASFMMIKGD